MDTFRKIISSILFALLVIAAGVFFINESNQPLKYRYEDEMAFRTTGELYQFLQAIPMTETISIKIENISERLPSNLRDYLMVRVSVQVSYNSTAELPLTRDYPNGWVLFGTWVGACAFSAWVCFCIIWPHED